MHLKARYFSILKHSTKQIKSSGTVEKWIILPQQIPIVTGKLFILNNDIDLSRCFQSSRWTNPFLTTITIQSPKHGTQQSSLLSLTMKTHAHTNTHMKMQQKKFSSQGQGHTHVHNSMHIKINYLLRGTCIYTYIHLDFPNCAQMYWGLVALGLPHSVKPPLSTKPHCVVHECHCNSDCNWTIPQGNRNPCLLGFGEENMSFLETKMSFLVVIEATCKICLKLISEDLFNCRLYDPNFSMGLVSSSAQTGWLRGSKWR